MSKQRMVSSLFVSIASSCGAAGVLGACSHESVHAALHPAADAKSEAAGNAEPAAPKPQAEAKSATTNATPSATKAEIVVYAATSTRDALQALETVYERDHAVDLVFNFGSSGDLSKQIVAAAKADMFISADDKEMDKVDAAKLLVAGSRVALLSNQLVVIEPLAASATPAPSLFTSPFAPAQLAQPAVKLLSLGNVETVPAGRYAKAWLEKVGVWKDVAERVLPGVDVRAALAAVESGGAQAGIVYRTDVARSKKARVVFAVPAADGPKITYPLALVVARPNEHDTRAWAEFLASGAAGKVFEEYGFVFLPGVTAAAKPATK